MNLLNTQKRYLTRKAISQRIGLTEGSVRTITDITLALRSVAEIDYSDPSGQPIAAIDVTMTNQRDEIMANGRAEARLPTEDLPAE